MLGNLNNSNAGNQTKSVVEKKHYEDIEKRLDELQDEIDSNTESINQNAQNISGLDDRVAAVEDNSTFPTLSTDTINPATGDKIDVTSNLDVDGAITADTANFSELSVNDVSFTSVAASSAQAKSIAETAENKADEAYGLADALSDELADYKADNEQSITTGTLNADSVVTDSIASQTINTNDFETTNAEIDDLYVDRIHATGELALPTIGQSYYTITIPAGTTASFAGSYITENDEIEFFYFTVTDGDVIYRQAALEVIKDISFDRETGNTKIRVKSTGAVTYISSSMNVADPTIEDGGSAYEDFSFIPQKLSGQIIRGYNDTTTETFVAGVLNAYAIVADEIHYERTVVDDLVVNDAIELPKEWNQSGNISRSSGTEGQYVSIQTKDGVDKPTWVSPANGTTGVLDNTSDKLITEKSVACYNGSTCDGTVYPITNLGDGTSVHGSISATCFCGNVSGTADASLASCKANCLVDGNNNIVLSSDCVKVGQDVVSIGCRSNCNKSGTFIGHFAGVNSEFEDNTGIGREALAELTRGQGNTAVGFSAGELICCGHFNTAVGMYSARNGSGDFFEGNTSVGYCSLFSMCSGLYNIAIGYGAMGETCSGTRNIAIGTRAGNKRGCNEISDSITIGYRVYGKEDALTIGREFCCCLTYDFIDGRLCGANLCGNATNAWRFNGCNYAQAKADILSGTAKDATCFNGCTYAQAKTDILSGTAAQAHCVDIDSLTTSSYPLVMESATCELGKSGTCSITFTPSTGILETNQVSTTCIENSGTTKSQYLCATCGLNVDGNAYIAGDLTVCGTTTTTHSEEVVTPSENIILRDEATTAVLPGCYSGFTVINYDGCDNDLEVGADKDGTLHVGVVGGTMEPVATRATEACMENDYVAHWDSTGTDLVTKGASCTHDLCINGNATVTGTLTADLTGTATNSTCFNGCTYECAKADILSGKAACADYATNANRADSAGFAYDSSLFNGCTYACAKADILSGTAEKAKCIIRISQPMTWIDASTSTISNINGVTFSCYNCSCTTQTECACGYPSNYGLVLTVNRYDETKPWGYQIAKATGGGRFYYRDWTNCTSVSNTWHQFIDSTGGQTINGNLAIPIACGSFCGNLCGGACQVKRNVTTCNGTCHLALFGGKTAIDNANLYVSNACPLTYNPSTGVLNVQKVCQCTDSYHAQLESPNNATKYITLKLSNANGYSEFTSTVDIDVFNNHVHLNVRVSSGVVSINEISRTVDYGIKKYLLGEYDDTNHTITLYFTFTNYREANIVSSSPIVEASVSSTAPTGTFIDIPYVTHFVRTSSTNAEYPLVFSTCCATPATGNLTLYNDSANNLMYNPSTNTLTACCVVGNTYTTCNSQKICVNNKLWELCCDGHIYFEGSLVV